MTMRRAADFFTYLTSDPANDWGIELTTVGYYHAAPRTKYPPPGHPKTHAFEWKTGRRLDEYQLIYVPTGIGCFENRHRRSEVSAGDLILLYRTIGIAIGLITAMDGKPIGSVLRDPISKNMCTTGYSRSANHLCAVSAIGRRWRFVDQLIALSKRDEPVFKTVALGCFLQIVAHAATYDEKAIASRRASTISEKAVDVTTAASFYGRRASIRWLASLASATADFRSIFKW